MPIKYRILPEAKLVHVVGSAVVDCRELIESLEDLAADPLYQPPMKKLVDYRNIRILALNHEEMDRFNRKKVKFRERFEGEQCAIVSDKNLDYRTVRDHSTQIDPEVARTRAFKDFIAACDWLELPAPIRAELDVD